MTQEYPGSTQGAKPAKRPNKALGKEDRSRSKRHRNALYTLAAEFRRRHPQATAATAWAHFIAVAATGCHEVCLRYDAARDSLEYAANPDRLGTRTVTRRGFAQQYYRLGNISR